MIETLNCFSEIADSEAIYLLQCFNLDQDLTSEAQPGRAGLEIRLLSRSFPSELHIPKGSQPTGPDETQTHRNTNHVSAGYLTAAALPSRSVASTQQCLLVWTQSALTTAWF